MNNRELDRIEASYATIIGNPNAEVRDLRVLAHNIPWLIQEVRKAHTALATPTAVRSQWFGGQKTSSPLQDTPRLDADRSGPLTRRQIILVWYGIGALSASAAGFIVWVMFR